MQHNSAMMAIRRPLLTLCVLLGFSCATDGPAVISVARSFGLSTTTGARGDAVAYVLRMHNDAVAASSSTSSPAESVSASSAAPSAVSAAVPSSPIGVVKVIKSKHVFQQELSAMLLMQEILPSPTFAFYPQLLAAQWALIPTAIPVAASGMSDSIARAFSRPYSVGSMGSDSAASSSSTDAQPAYCKGGLVLMDCAPGHPLSEMFTRVGREAAGSEARAQRMTELCKAIDIAAHALGELHRATVVDHPSVHAVHQFFAELAAQVRDMLGKLAAAEYAASVSKWQLDLADIRTQLDLQLHEAQTDPGCVCVIHGDAHAGNMLWSDELQKITLIDLPTMLHATVITEQHEGSACPQGAFPMSTVPSAAASTTAAAAASSSSSSVAPRFSAACAPPLLLSGCASASRDVSHFERKLDSHGSRRGLSVEEIACASSRFWSSYRDRGVRISDAARRFCRLRSLMGEITQTIKYEPEGMSALMREQLRQILNKEDADGFTRTSGDGGQETAASS